MSAQRPIIGITVDNRDNTAASGTYECSIGYSRAVSDAGGVPMLLPHEQSQVELYVDVCDGFVLTGGVDPSTEAFGEPTYPKVRPMDPARQRFELALLAALDARKEKAVLGVCLGMQLMALHCGGRLDQYLPETLDDAELHKANARHGVELIESKSALGGQAPANGELTVVSHHQQAVEWAGSLRVIAKARDGVIEAIDDPDRPFYLGVQWHPERGGSDDPHQVNQEIFDRLVAAAGAR